MHPSDTPLPPEAGEQASPTGGDLAPEGVARERVSEDPVRRFFREGFTARDLAEPLISFDGDRPAEIVRERMRALCLRVAGIRTGGHVTGFVRLEDLTGTCCAEHTRAFSDEQIVPPGASIREVVERLDAWDCLFVPSFGMVAGIITRTDMEKPPARMWLFGLLTVVEHALESALRRRYPDGSWTGLLSAGRVERARALQAERRRRGEVADLVSCLQFGDKGYALFRDPGARDRFGLASRTAAREAMRNLEMLRNALAHSQPIVTAYWENIHRFTHAIDVILELYDPPHARSCPGR